MLLSLLFIYRMKKYQLEKKSNSVKECSLYIKAKYISGNRVEMLTM